MATNSNAPLPFTPADPTGPLRYRWDLDPDCKENRFYRKPDPRFLESMLLKFPDPLPDNPHITKPAEILSHLHLRHKEQRRNLSILSRRQHTKLLASLSTSLDPSYHTYLPLYPPPPAHISHFSTPTVGLLATPAANTAIKNLPASSRYVLVHQSQLPERSEPPKDRRNSLGNLDGPGVGEGEERRMTTTELSAHLAKMAVLDRKKWVNEELEMRMAQQEAREVYQAAVIRAGGGTISAPPTTAPSTNIAAAPVVPGMVAPGELEEAGKEEREDMEKGGNGEVDWEGSLGGGVGSWFQADRGRVEREKRKAEEMRWEDEEERKRRERR